MAGVTGVTGVPEGDGRTLVCRWSTGIPAFSATRELQTSESDFVLPRLGEIALHTLHGANDALHTRHTLHTALDY